LTLKDFFSILAVYEHYIPAEKEEKKPDSRVFKKDADSFREGYGCSQKK
jgi:hypothetical protein